MCFLWRRDKDPLFNTYIIFYRIEEHDDHAPPIDETEDSFHNDPHLMKRRNSRSLPTSPLNSPQMIRKFQPQPNPYFTITGSEAPPPKP